MWCWDGGEGTVRFQGDRYAVHYMRPTLDPEPVDDLFEKVKRRM